MKKAKYCAEFYTEFGAFEHSVLSDNLYCVLQACLEGKSKGVRHTLYMLDGSEYIRIPDFEYNELTSETFRKYLAGRAVAGNRLLSDARITRNMVERSYRTGVIRLDESPHGDGVVCRIGRDWFYFGGLAAVGETVESYKRRVSEDEIIDEICGILDDFRNDPETYGEEYLYYLYYIEEHEIA